MKVVYGSLCGELISLSDRGETSERWELTLKTAENEKIIIFPIKIEKFCISIKEN